MNIRKTFATIAVSGILLAGLACGGTDRPEPTQTPTWYKTATPRPTPTIMPAQGKDPPDGYCRELVNRVAFLLREKGCHPKRPRSTLRTTNTRCW